VIAAFPLALAASGACAGEARWLVHRGQPAASIVLGDANPRRYREAAAELIYHVRKATGVSLSIIEQDAIRGLPQDHAVVVVGGGTLADSLGVKQSALADEQYRIMAAGRYLIFVGGGSEQSGSGTTGSKATRWAVGRFLDRHLGVRWLWPGDLGAFVPRAETIAVPDLDVTAQPRTAFRRLRLRVAFGDSPSLVGRDVIRRASAEVGTWLVRHQMGRRRELRGGHSYRHWWEQYHQTRPEVFATLSAGRKQPFPVADRAKLCVSHPSVQELILQEWREAGRPDLWPIGPNDGSGFCVCDACRSLDVPPTTTVDPEDVCVGRAVLTGRYLHLWKRVLDRMRVENPRVMLNTLAYSCYKKPPAKPLSLGHQRALIIFLVDGRSDAERRSLRQWKQVGAEIVLRPNWWVVGQAAPYLPLQEMGGFFKFALENGIVGFDFDAGLGYWGTQGLNYYLIARLSSRPDLTVDDIIAEYASAFGKGAPVIREYVALWERVTDGADYMNFGGRSISVNPEGLYERTLRARGLDTNPFSHGSWTILPFLYTDELLQKATALLDRAQTLAGPEDHSAQGRIEFLRDGLKHLRLARDVVRLGYAETRPRAKSREDLREQKRRFQRLCAELRAFQRDITPRHVVWEPVIRWHENRFRLKTSLRHVGKMGLILDPLPPEAWSAWEFRKGADDRGVREARLRDRSTRAGDWAPIHVPAFWSKTSVGAHLGYGWYRTNLRVPGNWPHEFLGLTFQGVDEQAWVYLNGQLVGEHTVESEGRPVGELWDRPFTIDVPAGGFKQGRQNALVVRVHNSTQAGGIWRRVTAHGSFGPGPSGTESLADGVVWTAGRSYQTLGMKRSAAGRAVVTVTDTTKGVIMEAGANGSGLALYVHRGLLYFQCGRGRTFGEDGQSLVKAPIKPGRRQIEWSADRAKNRVVLCLDGEIAGESNRPIHSSLAGNDPGGIGRVHNVICRNAAG